MVVERPASWQALVREFRWSIPPGFNMAEATVERHAASGRLAIVYDRGQGEPERLTFADLSERSSRPANILRGRGVRRSNRVGIFLPARPEAALTHLAAWKLGAVSLPLTTGFGPVALVQRLGTGTPAALLCSRRRSRCCGRGGARRGPRGDRLAGSPHNGGRRARDQPPHDPALETRRRGWGRRHRGFPGVRRKTENSRLG